MHNPNLLSTVYKQFHSIAKEVTGEELMPEELINKHAHILDERLDINEVVNQLKVSVADEDSLYSGSRLDLMCILYSTDCDDCPFNAVCEAYVNKLDKYSHYMETMTARAKVLLQGLISNVEGVPTGDSLDILSGVSSTYN